MLLRALAFAFLAWAAGSPALAATVAERSPFTQGQWWDPTRSGNGFELFNVGDEVMALWFTFDDNRRPIWYTAQGKLGATWTLLMHTWAIDSTHLAESRPAGTLRIDFLDDSQADATFSLNGRTGTWRIEPFNPGAKTNEVDHSGSYYAPTQPGWGFTLTEQGDVLGGVLYYYDRVGFPTWVAGFSRDSNGSVGMVSVRGSCPGCQPSGTDRVDGGRIEIEMLTENLATLRAVLADPPARGIDIDGRRLVAARARRFAAPRRPQARAAFFRPGAEVVSGARDAQHGVPGPASSAACRPSTCPSARCACSIRARTSATR